MPFYKILHKPKTIYFLILTVLKTTIIDHLRVGFWRKMSKNVKHIFFLNIFTNINYEF